MSQILDPQPGSLVRQQTLKQSTLSLNLPTRRRRADRIMVHPADINTGVHFVCHGAVPGVSRIPAHSSSMLATTTDTVLGDRQGASLRGTLPLLAALMVMGIDNAEVDVFGPTLPGELIDFHHYLELLAQAGIQSQSAPRRLWRVTETIEVHDPAGFVTLSPSSDFQVAIRHVMQQPGKSSHTVCADWRMPLGQVPPPLALGSMPVVLQRRMVELLGHLALAGAPLAGSLFAHESSPANYRALLQTMQRRGAVEWTTVDAHHTHQPTATPLGNNPTSQLMS